jgi:hypothetical protein
MDCPKCGFACEERGVDCPACGIVFAKFRPEAKPAAPPVSNAAPGRFDGEPVVEGAHEPAFELALEPALEPAYGRGSKRAYGHEHGHAYGHELEPEFESDQRNTLDANRFDKQPILAMLIGSALALWTLNSPFLYTLSNVMKTLVHELGHTFAGWGFGIPSVPAFDFTYGGGVTIHQDPSPVVLTLLYAALAYLLFLYRRKPRTLALLGALGVAHIASMVTGFDEPITIAMGHGFELLFAGIFFYRALSGFACVHGAERPLYGFLGFLITFDNMRFAYRLIHSHEHRWMYENAKGGGHWMDFDRLAREFLLVDLSAIAHVFMLASAAPLIISLALYCTRDRWVPSLGQFLSPDPEA